MSTRAAALMFLHRVGGAVILRAEDIGALTLQLWAAIWRLPLVLPAIGKRRRWADAVRQMLAIGVSALPMVSMMSLCIGFVVALEGAAETSRALAVFLELQSEAGDYRDVPGRIDRLARVQAGG